MRATAIRHGEAGTNKITETSKVGGDLPLTGDGIEQIRERAKKLRYRKLGQRALPIPRVVYHSPYRRTTESAEVLASECPEIEELVPDVRLQEIQKGAWHGQPVKQIMALEAEIPDSERHTYRAPGGGENWEDVAVRGVEFITEKATTLEDDEEAELMFVSHNHPILAVTGRLLGIEIQRWEDRPLGNGGLITIRGSLQHGWVEERHEST